MGDLGCGLAFDIASQVASAPGFRSRHPKNLDGFHSFHPEMCTPLRSVIRRKPRPSLPQMELDDLDTIFSRSLPDVAERLIG